MNKSLVSVLWAEIIPQYSVPTLGANPQACHTSRVGIFFAVQWSLKRPYSTQRKDAVGREQEEGGLFFVWRCDRCVVTCVVTSPLNLVSPCRWFLCVPALGVPKPLPYPAGSRLKYLVPPEPLRTPSCANCTRCDCFQLRT